MPLIQMHSVAVHIYGIRRHPVVTVILVGRPSLIKPIGLPLVKVDTDTPKHVVGLADQVHRPTARMVIRIGFGFDIDHPANRIRTVHKRCSTAYHFYISRSKLIDFQAMIGTPLLPFMFYSFFDSDHTVETHSTYKWL